VCVYVCIVCVVLRCVETSSENCSENTFVFDPFCGLLDGQLSVCSGYKTVVRVYFTAHAADEYNAVFVLEGILGEELQRIHVHGEGTHDGHFEALVNV